MNRSKKYYNWNKKHKVKKIFSFDWEIAIEFDPNMNRRWLRHAPKWHTKIRNKKFKSENKNILRYNTNMLNINDYKEYKKFVKDSAYLYW